MQFLNAGIQIHQLIEFLELLCHFIGRSMGEINFFRPYVVYNLVFLPSISNCFPLARRWKEL